VISGRLTWLRPAGEEDLDLLAGWFGDPAFVEHWGGTPLTRDEVAAKYVGRRRPEVESFVVMAGDAPIGYAQYRGGVGLDLILEPTARGHGYGPDAADALARYVLGELGRPRVTVDPEAENVRAVRAWEKAGFRTVSREGSQLLMVRGLSVGIPGAEPVEDPPVAVEPQ
jgi:aminoglycoside 6'-N-acetyltransferase